MAQAAGIPCPTVQIMSENVRYRTDGQPKLWLVSLSKSNAGISGTAQAKPYTDCQTYDADLPVLRLRSQAECAWVRPVQRKPLACYPGTRTAMRAGCANLSKWFLPSGLSLACCTRTDGNVDRLDRHKREPYLQSQYQDEIDGAGRSFTVGAYV